MSDAGVAVRRRLAWFLAVSPVLFTGAWLGVAWLALGRVVFPGPLVIGLLAGISGLLALFAWLLCRGLAHSFFAGLADAFVATGAGKKTAAASRPFRPLARDPLAPMLDEANAAYAARASAAASRFHSAAGLWDLGPVSQYPFPVPEAFHAPRRKKLARAKQRVAAGEAGLVAVLAGFEEDAAESPKAWFDGMTSAAQALREAVAPFGGAVVEATGRVLIAVLAADWTRYETAVRTVKAAQALRARCDGLELPVRVIADLAPGREGFWQTASGMRYFAESAAALTLRAAQHGPVAPGLQFSARLVAVVRGQGEAT